MKLVIGNIVIANSATDGMTRWIRADKPKLSLRVASTPIVGMSYARNTSRAWGMTLAFSVIVGRTFADATAAESFAIEHLSALSDGATGLLKYENAYGKMYGFENAALKDVSFTSEIGISTETQYDFVCGKPRNEFPFGITIGGSVATLDGYAPTINSI